MLLAEAGLLSGRRATTHWRLLETMQTRFPDITLEAGPLYVQDGPVWTSGGVSSGFDLTLALVEDDYGFSLALEVAQNMVMYLRRHGGQLQFSRYNLQQASSVGPISDLQSWILSHLNEDLSVDKLAERAAMSPRNFTRVFTRETGAPPARYVAEARPPRRVTGWNKPTKRWTRLPLRPALAAVSIYGGFSNASYTLPRGEYRQRFHCRKMA